MSSTYSIILNYEFVDTIEDKCDAILRFAVLKDGTTNYFENNTRYYNLPKYKEGDPADIDHPVASITKLLSDGYKRLLGFRNNKFVDTDPGPALRIDGLNYKTMVELEAQAVELLNNLVDFGRKNKKYKEK